MKRLFGVLSLAGALALVFAIAYAAEEKEKEGVKPITMKGEIVDMGCYLGHAAMGEKHKECAVTCVAAGMPIGLLTEKNMVYLLVPPHDNKDGYNKAKEWVSAKVEITGTPFNRAGMKAIEVVSAKPVAASAPETSSK